jgi:hypothetical protein
LFHKQLEYILFFFCEEYNNKTKTWTREECDLVLDKLQTIPKNKQKLFFYFYGGEPTLSKNWEYLNYRILELFPDKEIFLQTQTNLSIDNKRLEEFLIQVNHLKGDNHTVDICSSYHLNKQLVSEFIEKMRICEKHNALGLCFFSTELCKKEQTLSELNKILKFYPDRVKLRFTEIEGLALKRIAGYEEYLSDEYLVGNDCGKSLDFRYWLREYPYLRRYFEDGWNFKVNDKIYNFSEVSGYNIHKKFKFMKCSCGTKNIVIDHNLKVYHCNDDFNNQINITQLRDIPTFCDYLKKDVRCLNNACYDGLDHLKYRK